MAEHMAESTTKPAATKPAKSPPLAFQVTSNDSLVAPINPSATMGIFHSPDSTTSPSAQNKLSSFGQSDYNERQLQIQVHKQAEALRLQQLAFAAERECWDFERDRLYRRILSLENLLKSVNGHRYVQTTSSKPSLSNAHLEVRLAVQTSHRSVATLILLPNLAQVRTRLRDYLAFKRMSLALPCWTDVCRSSRGIRHLPGLRYPRSLTQKAT